MNNAWVIGDIMLDEWIQGVVERISPEAPVPILWEHATGYALGGAANVAKQMAAWGARVSLAGVLGDDEDGHRVLTLCAQSGIGTRSVVMAMRRTTRKTRAVCMGKGQQLLRIDRETREPFECEWSDLPVEPKVIVLSDYGKGVLIDKTIARFRAFTRECPVIVDPKRKDLRDYAGCSVLTPNLKELCGDRVDPMDHDEIERVAYGLIEEASLEAILVTLGEWGMMLVHRDWSEYIAPHPLPSGNEVVDATGAGDVAVAVFAAELSRGQSMSYAAQLANRAAGISVHKLGVQTVRMEEVT